MINPADGGSIHLSHLKSTPSSTPNRSENKSAYSPRSDVTGSPAVRSSAKKVSYLHEIQILFGNDVNEREFLIQIDNFKVE